MKINDKNLAAFATSQSQVDKAGYLMKKGDGSKNFAKRWFVLKGNLLFYFEKKTDKEPLGVIILEGSTVELAESEMEEHFCFKIVFPSKAYIVGAESHQVMEQWMKALACASYDYVKLMAAELQRQLNELCQAETAEEVKSASKFV
ncbi:Sesquipedalian-1 [Orchesella cincta]|uniref:Sesquipedalian-1 n=1 Tax=Orchesella cincta TaxID=48709 RepID=A0A1D2NFM4_ORCCI|nr:Sesquipedalian-1 [Orchesella cincta]